MSEAVHDPNRRQRYFFQRDGENLIVDIWMEPGGDMPAHFHPLQEERWSVVEGQVRFTVAGKTQILGPDDGEIIVAPKVKHAAKNKSGKEARLRAEVRPAGDLQGFLESFAEAARAGLYTRRGLPKKPRGMIVLVKLLRRYRRSTVIAGPPRLIQLG